LCAAFPSGNTDRAPFRLTHTSGNSSQALLLQKTDEDPMPQMQDRRLAFT